MILKDDAKIFFTFGGILFLCSNGIILKIQCNQAPSFGNKNDWCKLIWLPQHHMLCLPSPSLIGSPNLGMALICNTGIFNLCLIYPSYCIVLKQCNCLGAKTKYDLILIIMMVITNIDSGVESNIDYIGPTN